MPAVPFTQTVDLSMANVAREEVVSLQAQTSIMGPSGSVRRFHPLLTAGVARRFHSASFRRSDPLTAPNLSRSLLWLLAGDPTCAGCKTADGYAACA